MELTIVIPVYNEYENINSLINEIIATFNDTNINYQILFINDGSTDDSYSLLKDKSKEYEFCDAIHHKKSMGQSYAVVTGVLNAKADIIATVDGDGQNDPKDIIKLYKYFNNNKIDLVIGNRINRKDIWLKRISSKVANYIRSSMLKDDTLDSGCALKVFTKDTFLKLPRFDHMHRYLPALILRDKGIVHSVAVNHRHRIKGRSKYGIHNRLWVGIVDLLGVKWLIKRAKNPKISQ